MATEWRAARLLLQPWPLSTQLVGRPSLATARLLDSSIIPKKSIGVRDSTNGCLLFHTSAPNHAKRAPPPFPNRGRKSRSDTEVNVSIKNISVLLPMTMVPPPASRWPRDSPGRFGRMGYLVLKNRFMGYLSLVLHKISSMPSFFSRPVYKLRKGTIIPTARELHRQMHTAMASGDKALLHRICTAELYDSLAGTIDSRPRHVRVEWELERFTDRLTYPKLTDDKITLIPFSATENRTIRQAIITISSVQRIARYDRRNGALIEGSERSSNMLEHLVLTADVDPDTWEQTPWRIWGTLPESTLDGFEKEVQAYTGMANE
ncbi:hypothetical protein BX600DRAFT_464995 [Xylariales sp. PMI_506]|nr:hypothetical protein BX600DRAFT_464995 [Xylariales sp. PMI_506]